MTLVVMGLLVMMVVMMMTVEYMTDRTRIYTNREQRACGRKLWN